MADSSYTAANNRTINFSGVSFSGVSSIRVNQELFLTFFMVGYGRDFSGQGTWHF